MNEHYFGGSHTEAKLSCLRDYLASFSSALSGQGFARIYIDAFAGTGSRTEVRASLPILEGGLSCPQEITTDGSARIALDTKPEFHRVVLIEQDKSKLPALENLRNAYGATRTAIYEGDANDIVQKICLQTAWRGTKTVGRGIRGVIFLDPYGMEVSWDTVQAIANTKALDCWYFFPLAGLYRNAPHDPLKIDESKFRAISRVFGTEDWYNEWYKPKQQEDLFGVAPSLQRTVDVDAIEKYVHERLKTVFKGTVLKPLRLYNSGGKPLASLFFAVSNTSGAAVGLATKIADHILSRGNSSQTR